MSYGLMRWRLICLVRMASSMCSGDQVRSTKIGVSCLQLSMVVGLSWSGAAWVLQVLESYILSRGNRNSNMYCEILQLSMIPIPPETGAQGSVPAWQWPQTHIQDDLYFTDGLAQHISRLEPSRTSLGNPQAEGGGAQSLKYPPAPWRCHGRVEEHSSGYLWSSGKIHAQESKGSSE